MNALRPIGVPYDNMYFRRVQYILSSTTAHTSVEYDLYFRGARLILPSMTSPILVDYKSYTCGAQVLYLSNSSPDAGSVYSYFR